MVNFYSENLSYLYKLKRKLQPFFENFTSKKYTYWLEKGDYVFKNSSYSFVENLKKLDDLNKNSWLYFCGTLRELYKQYDGSNFFLREYARLSDKNSKKLRYVTSSNILQQHCNSIESVLSIDNVAENALLIWSLCMGFVAKSYNHFFIEDMNLPKVLKELEVKNIKDIFEYCLKLGKGVASNNYEIGFLTYGLCLHLPNEKNGISVIIYFAQKDEKLFLDKNGDILIDDLDINIVSNRNNFFVGTGNKDFKIGYKNNWNELEKAINEKDYLSDIKIALNFISYINCFSESIKDSVPECVKEKSLKGGKTVGFNKSFSCYVSNGSVVPHLRMGHFRYLKNDCFTKKKNTWVFVKPTMVGTKAKTVEQLAPFGAK